MKNIILTLEEIDNIFGLIKEKLSEELSEENPHAVSQYLLELTSLGGLTSTLVGSSRYHKDMNKGHTYVYEACCALQKDVHYRVTAISTVLGYLGKERLAER